MTSRIRAAWFLVVLTATPASAWGPHTEITRAALAVLPERERLQKLFGADWDRLARDYCWMGDWREAVRPDHYADDYLLFPAMPAHPSHMLPEVRRTYDPFFRRALQSLRTESPRNAARWLGSLLHFVQDSGSPPHTTGIGGALHGKMERWVDETRIHIDGYEPALLGADDDAALAGFLERMERLVEFSKARAIRLKPLVENVAERVNQPLELECALETARVSADVLHTLFTLGLRPPRQPGCTLRGRLEGYHAPTDYAAVPAKLMLHGTLFSTTTGDDGTFELRNLPAGTYDVSVLATGYEAETRKDVLLASDAVTRLDVKLRPDRAVGNLVRNPAFAVSWMEPPRPDGWTRDPLKGNRWASALIRVPVEKQCSLRVLFVPGKSAAVAVRWRADPSQAASGREAALPATNEDVLSATIAPDPRIRPFEKGVLFLEVLIETQRPLAEVCRHVAVTLSHD